MTARPRHRGRGRTTALRAGAPLVGMILAVVGCGEPAAHARTAEPVPSASATPSASVATATSCADRVYNGMTQAQRIGQLFMGGVSATKPSATDLRTLRDQHVGSVMLTGRSSTGTKATRKVVDGFRGQADTVAGRKVGLLVATDQEGGQVQVLSGPGFSTIPTALTQGSWSTSTLRSRAAGWAGQLKSAGVDLNLAPVADVVPASLGTRNGPIGRYYREYGHTPDTVASHSGAFAAGFKQAHVMTTLKHFPGLGRVTGNTDTTANVVDSVTTATSSYLTPFKSGIKAGAPFVMVSSATYSKIDAHHIAAFSPTVIRKLLRTQLGFKGVVISDDLGQAVAVKSFTPAQRAVDFLSAGGNLLLTVKPSILPAMTKAVGARMKTDAAFRATVTDSVHRVLAAKAAAGLLSCG
ncbi:glycoside hydrolase family 3 N-terminal domain-containing protein [Streptomyces sp. NRRL S-31]|uniref:glycoside hydrolase family 3 N-terminal domain-containing protein n=1 Tax=Streptomyces sp. NRRL S-31 TaxID=1463898 RepID=UPI0004CB2453|nr:glycoside hydrolase family 3 N-terminal domain-containing protein [Streptomyces sp. NRRL S-31]